jgi:hypothetical protein
MIGRDGIATWSGAAAAALVASLAGAYAGARLGGRGPAAPQVVQPAWRGPEAIAERCPAPPPGPPALGEAERRALAAEIAAAVDAQAHPAGDASRAPAPPAPSPAALAAGAEAARLLDQAVRAGAWTDGDAETAQGLMAQLAPEDAGELLRGWAAAVNRGDLKVRTSRPPW